MGTIASDAGKNAQARAPFATAVGPELGQPFALL